MPQNYQIVKLCIIEIHTSSLLVRPYTFRIKPGRHKRASNSALMWVVTVFTPLFYISSFEKFFEIGNGRLDNSHEELGILARIMKKMNPFNGKID
jgi:hypothetical protein